MAKKLTAAHAKLVRQRLEAEREKLREEIERETSLLGVRGTASSREDGDLAQEEDEDSTAANTIEALRSKFLMVEAALERIDQGTYGTCADCGQPIPQARLQALPEAIRCTSCQEAYEARSSAAR